MRYVFDIETNGFLHLCDKVHCIVIKDIDTGEILTPSNEDAIKLLEDAELIIGHNIIKFDIPVLEKLYSATFKGKIFDTLVGTRLVYADIKENDFSKKDFPKDCIGKHSLKAWGNRIGEYKEQIQTDWQTFTPEMLEYCKQDTEVTYKLYKVLEEKGYSQEAMDLEHEVASLIFKQEQHGFTFDREKAEALSVKLKARQAELAEELQGVFEPIVAERWSTKTGKRLKDSVTVFNPSSRHHVAQRLKDKYGWEAKEFTSDGKAKLDDSILSKLPYPEAKILCETFLLTKRIAQIATGSQAWLKHERNGKIHGTCNTNSCVTSRASHSFPNLGQVVSTSAPYGKECRELFTVPEGKRLVGIDVSSLEVLMLCHFMSKFDNGEYAKVALEGDIHTETQKLAGLDSRDLAKRFYYCFLYGGSVKKIAEVINKPFKEAGKIKKRFLNNLPALHKLIEAVQSAAERGYLTGLDKRQIKVRNSYSALNTLLQSAGAILCKRWLVEFNKEIKKFKNAQQVVWVHDEIQVECEQQDAEDIGKIAVKCIKRAGEHFQLRVPLTGEYKISTNWSGTH
ncbi:DNA polymerase [Pelagibacter phage Jormungand EXVC012P]|nr:DNA polymerase [Pelagibacter phage Jormungand EXVC012P]QLF88530.1 DNA polymerase [Pelagibacter phage Ran EXVC014P]